MYVDQSSKIRPLMLTNYTEHNQVQDKLDRLQSGSKPVETVRSSVDSQGPAQVASQPTAAEDLYEILCNDTLLPYEMTLAAVRQFVWRQGTELVMHYRRKRTNLKSEEV